MYSMYKCTADEQTGKLNFTLTVVIVEGVPATIMTGRRTSEGTEGYTRIHL